MRRPYNIINKGVEVQNKNYQLSDSTGAFKAINDLTLAGTLDIVLSHGNLRDEDMQWRNISVMTNIILSKMPITTYIPFSMISYDNTLSSSNVLVSQGPGSKPIWKSTSVVFPEADIYDVESDDAIIIRGGTFLTSSFINTTVLLNQFISTKGYTLETVDFTNDFKWYSHRIRFNVVPVKCPVIAKDDITVTLAIASTLQTNIKHTFAIISVQGTIREVNIPVYFYNTGQYKVNKTDLMFDENTDKDIYLSGHIVKTSMTGTTDTFHNYVVNTLDSITLSKDFAVDIWGATNTMTTNIPYRSGVKKVDFNHHFGFIIKNDSLLYGFGTDTRGELNNKPISKVIDVSCGREHACCILEDGSLVLWGSNDYKQLTSKPSGRFKKVKCSDYATAAISDTNELFIWGELGFDISSIDFKSLEVQDVVFGDKFLIIHTIDNKLIGYGSDAYGQLSNIPNKAIKKVSCGRYHVAAIDMFGFLSVWGSDLHSQLTGADLTLRYSDISCGDYFTVALKQDGTIKTWGNNSSNQVTNSPTSNTYTAIYANSNNAVGLKDEKVTFTKRYKENIVTGDKFSAQIIFEHDSDIVNDINVQLTQLK